MDIMEIYKIHSGMYKFGKTESMIAVKLSKILVTVMKPVLRVLDEFYSKSEAIGDFVLITFVGYLISYYKKDVDKVYELINKMKSDIAQIEREVNQKTK